MIKILRFNNWIVLTDCPSEAIEKLHYHLALPVEYLEVRGQSRFGGFFEYNGQTYGSLLLGDRVPSGLLPYVLQTLRHYGYQWQGIDHRRELESPLPLWSVTANWRPYQMEVHKSVNRNNAIGIVDAPPRSGKTLMAIRAIDTYSYPCVYIAPSVAIVRQTYEQLKSFFGEDYVSRIDGSAKISEKDPSKQIVVSTPITAARMPQEWWDGRFLLVIDEFHHAAAETYHVINSKAANAYHRLCFTGTHFRTGDDELAMEAICSQKIYKIEVGDLVQQKYLAAPRIRFIPIHGGGVASNRYDAVYRHGIVGHEKRNQKIVELANLLTYHRYPTLILTNQRAHADLLGEYIAGSKVVKGGEAALTDQAISEFRQGQYFVLIGTSVIGEGVDIPNAKALIYATGGGYTVGMLQSYFRPLTYQDDKPEGVIYDFYDHQHKTLLKQSTRRFEYTREYLGDCVGML